ncbi:centromere protein T-like [Takifugu rubripes]|uniref:centromere protein T-like n=1 Tax=Takifugu rubripes TaxID=31033 RepID=UPI001145AC30|nr:centromere protein T-like [Takifugu rubripes]
MDPTEDLSARVLLRHILSTEPPRTPITRSVTKAQSLSVTRRSSRLSNKDNVGQTPQDLLRRNLRQKMRESITTTSLPPTKRRTAVKRESNTAALMSFDDGGTPRHILKNILMTEPVRSPVVHRKTEAEEPQPFSANSSLTGKNTSIELSGLDLPDLTMGIAPTVTKGLSRKRQRQSLNVTAFEKRLKGGDDVGEESELWANEHSSLSLSGSTSLSLKTPFADVQTEKRGLQRRVSNRRKITEEAFGAAVNRIEMGGMSSFVGLGPSDNTCTEGLTLGLSTLSEPDITTDIVQCDTDRDTRLKEESTTRSHYKEEESARDSQTEESDGDPQPEVDVSTGTQSQEEEEEEEGAQKSHSEEECGDPQPEVEVFTGSQSQEEEEEGAQTSHSEEECGDPEPEVEVFTGSQSQEEEEEDEEEEEGAQKSHSEEECGDPEPEVEVSTGSQSQEEEEEEEGAQESHKEEECGDPEPEVEVFTGSQSQEEEEEDEEEEEGAQKSHSEEECGDPEPEVEVSTGSQSQEEEEEEEGAQESHTANSQTKDLNPVDCQADEEEEDFADDERGHKNSPEEDLTHSEAEELEEHGDGRVSEEHEAHCSGGVAVHATETDGDASDTGCSEDESKAKGTFILPITLGMGDSEADQPLNDFAESSTTGRPDVEYPEDLVDKENCSEDGRRHDSPAEGAADDSDESEDEEEREDVPSKTPAFVRKKRVFSQPFDHNVQPSGPSKSSPAKSKQVRKPSRPRKRQEGLPKSYLMNVFKHFAKTKVSADVYPVLNEVMDKFFERLAEDLETYAAHAKRKTIDVEDAKLLLKVLRLMVRRDPTLAQL